MSGCKREEEASGCRAGTFWVLKSEFTAAFIPSFFFQRQYVKGFFNFEVFLQT